MLIRLTNYQNSQILTSITIENSIPTLQEAFYLWNASLKQVASTPGIVYTVTIQPINNAVLSKQKSPGNSLGLPTSAPTGSLIIVELAATWNLASNSLLVSTAATKLMNKITAAAKARGTLHRWVDLNHATTGQSPINGYGAVVRAQLVAVSKKYDPKGVFQILVPGGFKLKTKYHKI